MPLTVQDLRERARPWIEPISSEAPAGKSAKLDPAYESIVKEIAQLESPSGGAVDWARIVDAGGGLLKRNSKDLLIASYVGYGLYATRGLSGLVEGISTLAELLESYWPTLFPEATRLRARVNALSWFLDRTARTLPPEVGPGTDREMLNGLELATQRLAEVVREKFASNGPAFGPLLQALERLRMSLPETSPATADGAQTTKAAPTETSSSAPSALASPGALTDAAGIVDFLRQVGDSLASAASMLRRTDSTNPLSYRILRAGLWLHVQQLPKAGPQGRSPIPPMPASLRTRLEQMSANSKWVEVLEEAESALVMNRFNLDLQRFSAQSLAGLGASHQGARDGAVGELAAWLRRMPAVLDLVCSDGTPIADPQTKEWLKLEVQAAGSTNGPGGSGQTATEDGSALLDQARALVVKGKLPDAIRLLQEQIQATAPGRARFRARLALAKACAAAGQNPLARALYAILDQECIEHALDTWEPDLVVECLEGLLLTVRTVRPGNPLPPEFATHYQRLCKLSLSAALRIER